MTDAPKQETPLPCPFCGGSATASKDDWSGKERWLVVCDGQGEDWVRLQAGRDGVWVHISDGQGGGFSFNLDELPRGMAFVESAKRCADNYRASRSSAPAENKVRDRSKAERMRQHAIQILKSLLETVRGGTEGAKPILDGIKELNKIDLYADLTIGFGGNETGKEDGFGEALPDPDYPEVTAERESAPAEGEKK